MGAGVPKLTWDMGALYPIDKLTVWMYSKSTDLRATKFIVQVSKDNSTWTTVADKSAKQNFNLKADGFLMLHFKGQSL